MREETEIDLYAASQKGEEYDESCKAVWKNKEILAPLLKYTVVEYRDSTIEEIIKYIDADTITEDIPVGDVPPTAIDRGTEFSSTTEKLTRYDLRFEALNPALSDRAHGILVMLHIGAEFQMSYRPKNPTYPIMKRAVYYAAREISSQLGALTEKTNYGDLEKVYSIWICTRDVPPELRNTMTRYTLHATDVIGSCHEPEADYDLMEIVMIRRGEETDDESIFDYLNGVFSSDLPRIDKYIKVSDNPSIRKEVEKMSGMWTAVAEEQYSKGKMQGISQGISQGETMTTKLFSLLLADGRIEDAKKAASDEKARKEFYKQYGIID